MFCNDELEKRDALMDDLYEHRREICCDMLCGALVVLLVHCLLSCHRRHECPFKKHWC